MHLSKTPRCPIELESSRQFFTTCSKKGGASNFQLKPLIPQEFQPFSQFSKPFVAQNLHNDQTNTALLKCVRELIIDEKNLKLIMEQ